LLLLQMSHPLSQQQSGAPGHAAASLMASQPGADHAILHASDSAGLQHQQQQHNHNYSNTDLHHPLPSWPLVQQEQQQEQGVDAGPAGHLAATPYQQPVQQLAQFYVPQAAAAGPAMTLHAAAEQPVQQAVETPVDAAAASVAALPGSAPLMPAVAGQPVPQQGQQQQQQQQAFGALSAAAALAYAEFAAGMPLRMWEQKSGINSPRWITGTVYDFTCMGCLTRGGDADMYLVELTRITLPTNPSSVRATAAGAAAASKHKPAAARMFTAVPAPSLRVGSLYVLKVSRPQQSPTGVQPTPAAAREFLQEAASRMHNQHMCYVALQGSEYVVQCFGYGSATVLVPVSADAVTASAAAAAAAPLPTSSSAAEVAAVATPVAAFNSASSSAADTAASSSTAAAAAARVLAVPSAERPCLLLEYVPGGSVKALLQTAAGEPAGMSEDQAKSVVQDVTLALRDCNSERILYRDLHPGNIVCIDRAAVLQAGGL
jgi:hypothetical protein